MAVSEGMGKLLYVVVVEDDDDSAEDNKRSETPSSFRYTRSVLQSTLQLMGCKPRHAFKISQRVFEMLRQGSSVSACEGVPQYNAKVHHLGDAESQLNDRSVKANADRVALAEDEDKSQTFELYKRRTTVVVRRKYFLDVVCEALSEYKYVGPNQRADLVLACRIRERKESVIVLLCGTSGCGKSTLSALLGSRLGITTIVSTDSIRHMMRSFIDEKENPLLWASTYHAGEHLDPFAVAQAKAKRQQMKKSSASKNDEKESATGKSEANSTTRTDVISQKQMAIEGYKAQSEMVIDSLDRLITSWEERRESVVMEGVHLSLNFVTRLMKKHPSIVPFMIYISNEEKHLERFAVRAKYMTLDPAKNKYVKYIRNIRTIQEYLINRADKHLVPKINNTNVDKSVAVIHATVFSCLRRRILGKQRLYDPITSTLTVVDEEYRNQRAAYSASSKGMLQLIQRKGSTRHLMALLNNDGSVAKAWPVDMTKESGKPMYDGPLQIDKAEPINLQFGHFGISAWLSDNGGTSHASSLDESRGELTDYGSRYFSSCGSSPKGTASKEIKGEESEDGSDEEVTEEDSDEELGDTQKHLQEELEGSVDEEFTEFDEEQDDDLAVLDRQDSGYLSDEDDAEFKMEMNYALRASQDRFGQQQILDRQTMSGSFDFPIPLVEGGDEKYKIRRRSHSIASLGSILWVRTGQEVLPR